MRPGWEERHAHHRKPPSLATNESVARRRVAGARPTAATARAADAPPQDATVLAEAALDRVTVTATRPATLPTEIPTTIESITGKQVERTINATDAEDALKYLPSLLVRKRYIGDYDHAVLATRASGTGNSARSLVYADGILLSNLLGNGATFAPRWGMVTPEEIERVDVLYGPFSAAYPGNSAGAVVDYVTRMPNAVRSARQGAGLHVRPIELYATDQRFNGWRRQRVARQPQRRTGPGGSTSITSNSNGPAADVSSSSNVQALTNPAGRR